MSEILDMMVNGDAGSSISGVENVALVLLLLGSWMIHSMVDFSHELWSNLPLYAK